MSQPFLGRHPEVDRVVHVQEAGSSNDLALEESRKDRDTLVLYLVDRQTAGRGRRGNTWWSDDGALTFSLLVATDKVGIRQESWGYIPLAAGLAVTNAIRDFVPGRTVSVKWPNDVYIDDGKVAGILVEQCPDRPTSLVIGIGVNVNVDLDAAPADLRSQVASIASPAAPADRLAVLFKILDGIPAMMEHLLQSPDRLVAALNQHSYLTGRRVTVTMGNERITGTCTGIAPSGGLLLTTPTGPRDCIAGTVTVNA